MARLVRESEAGRREREAFEEDRAQRDRMELLAGSKSALGFKKELLEMKAHEKSSLMTLLEFEKLVMGEMAGLREDSPAKKKKAKI